MQDFFSLILSLLFSSLFILAISQISLLFFSNKSFRSEKTWETAALVGQWLW